MKMSALQLRIHLGVLVVVAVALFCWFAASQQLFYDVGRYRGDGSIVDHGLGFGICPRFEVNLGSIPLAASGHHIFQMHGLPREMLILMLQVKDMRKDGDRSYDGLKMAVQEVAVDIRLKDDKGKNIRLVKKQLKEWELEWSVRNARFYTDELRDIMFYTGVQYTLEVFITQPTEQAELEVCPVLLGGGIEGF